MAYVTIKAGIAPLPIAWILERSVDGVSFSPWQYFAESETECRKRYGIGATQPKPHYKTDDEITCLINYSKLYYADNEEVSRDFAKIFLKDSFIPIKSVFRKQTQLGALAIHFKKLYSA